MRGQISCVFIQRIIILTSNFFFSRKCSYFPLWICMRGYDLRMTIMRGHWRDVEINLYGGCSSKNVFTLMLFCMSMLFFLYNTSEWRPKKILHKSVRRGFQILPFLNTKLLYGLGRFEIESQIMYLFFFVIAWIMQKCSMNILLITYFCVSSNHADIETI